MSLQKLIPDNIENFSLETNPSRTYVSSSSGVTGSVNLFARRSHIFKDTTPAGVANINGNTFSETTVESVRDVAVMASGSDISGLVNHYMNVVNAEAQSQRMQQQLDIIRFVPPFDLNSNSLRKSISTTTLMQAHRVDNPRANYSVTNYNCLNFMSSSALPGDAVMLYPNEVTTRYSVASGSQYALSGSFTFDFFIKPKYHFDADNVYIPGCLLHLPESYSITLHSGSSVDEYGNIKGFRIGVQVDSDANTTPDAFAVGTHSFMSTDNSIDRDTWNHVTITYGGPKNSGTGSIYINNALDSTFSFDPSGFRLGFYNDATSDPHVLAVGNYIQSVNTGSAETSRFFAADTATREGLVELNGTSDVFGPDATTFSHPLAAEVFDIKIIDDSVSLAQHTSMGTDGISDLTNVRFYLPPFFTKESPYRQSVASSYGTFGGELVTPFFEQDSSTETQFAANMAFGCGGFYVNLENYTRDFASNNYPRMWNLSASIQTPPSTTILSANDFLYATGSVVHRLYRVLPCDEPNFVPNFGLLSDLSQDKFVNDLGNNTPGEVTLNNMISDTFIARSIMGSGSLINQQFGARPEDITTVPGNSLAVLHRTRDTSSNQCVIFDVSNMFYGKSIKPGSLTIIDPSLEYVENIMGITIKDDGKGNLYRVNDKTFTGASWASVGTVFYEEGIILIKYPQLFFTGLNQFELQFEGMQNIHVLTINAFARSGRETTSINPTYQQYALNDNANNNDPRFVYITGINVHDDNLNVIMRTRLAQPIAKKSGEKFLFKLKLDY